MAEETFEEGAERARGATYTPTPEEAALIRDTQEKVSKWKQDRQTHEPTWFLNHAMLRGQHYVEYDNETNSLKTLQAKPERIRLKLNRIQAKHRARQAKFLRNRPKPVVVPATTEYSDYLKAKGTQRMLDYEHRRMNLEQKFKDALGWAAICAKGYWWLHWNPRVKGRILNRDPQTGIPTYAEQELGDVEIEVGTAFEVLVKDPGKSTLAEQPELIRVTLEPLDVMQRRYPAFAPVLTADTGDDSLFRYERMIATLSPRGITDGRKTAQKDYVTVYQHFIRPGGRYAEGHYRVVVGAVLVKTEDALPYGFSDLENPYPVVEFTDIPLSGSYWTPTQIEFLTDLQREYNLLRSKAAEHARWMAYPKIFVAKQHQLPKNAWTADPGEFIEYAAYPNVPPPQPWTPPPISADIWKQIELIQKEFDDLSQVFPVSEGGRGGTTSGFQANLLQEASDTVHGPDLRQHERSLEDAYRKIRRLVKYGYQVPRILSVLSPSAAPEAFEFSSDTIDEYADIVVQIGSALPDLKAARQETVMNLYNAGLLGDVGDPEVRKRALSLLEMGAIDEAFDLTKSDENQARWENRQFAQLVAVPDPEFWEHHKIHYNSHTDWLKSPEGREAPPALRMAVIRHTVLHSRWINPQSALQIAQETGLQDPDVFASIQRLLPPPMPAGPPGLPPTPQGPPPGSPPGPPGPGAP